MERTSFSLLFYIRRTKLNKAGEAPIFMRITPQTVRNYFGGTNYEFGKNCGVHIEPGPDGGIVVLDDTTIYDMAVEILQGLNKEA